MNSLSLLRNALSLCAIAAASSAFAATLSPDQALARAVDGALQPLALHSSSGYRLAYTEPMPDSAAAGVYVFASGSSFLAVSADDCAPALLGYSDQPFDAAAMPPALAWWLGEYARQIEAAAAVGLQPASARTADTKAPIGPLVTTLWNQDSPFNDKCPVVNGARSVTGCVATALAQVMNYHKYPAVGQGSTTNTNDSVSINFASLTFDWANMADEYNSQSTSAQNDAVATLMYACGMAVDMDYSPTESGASASAIAPAMYRYFGYDKSVFSAYRNFYGINDWNDFVYNQLQNYGPVQYSGVNANSDGHSFVCDGYSSDGYFHINWGWGGMSDGYFLLTALNPESQGIGGSTLGYNYDQSVVANVGRPVEGAQFTPVVYMPSGLSMSPTSGLAAGSQVTVSSQYANYSFEAVTGTPGLKFVDASGASTYTSTDGLSGQIASFEATYNASLALPALPDGTYTVTPAFYTGGAWTDVRVQVGGVQQYTATISDGNITLSPATLGKLSVLDVDVLSEMYFTKDFKVSATLANTGDEEYIGSIMPALLDSYNQMTALGDAYNADIVAGGSQDITYIGSFTQTSTTDPGEYKFVFVDGSNGDVLSTPVTVTVNAAPSTTTVTISDFHLVGDSQAADPQHLLFEGTLSCTEGYYGGQISVYICTTDGRSVQIINGTDDAYFLGSGDTADYRAEGKYVTATPGTRYMAIPGYVKNSTIEPFTDEPLYFTIATPTGLEEVGSATDAVYINLQGIPVENPRTGTFIRLSAGRATKIKF